MANQIIPFDFESHEIRTLLIDDQLWFLAMDVAHALAYTDAQAMTRKLDDDETQNRQIVGFGNRGIALVNESGLYSAILRSRKPEAKRFKKWVTAEVLPSIRKHGRYEQQGLSDMAAPALQGEQEINQIRLQSIKDIYQSQLVANGQKPVDIETLVAVFTGSERGEHLCGEQSARAVALVQQLIMMETGYIKPRETDLVQVPLTLLWNLSNAAAFSADAASRQQAVAGNCRSAVEAIEQFMGHDMKNPRLSLRNL